MHDSTKPTTQSAFAAGSVGTGKQIMQFGAGLGLSKLALERWAGRVLSRLDRGATEDEANLWIHAKMADLRSNPLWSREAR